MRKVGVKEESSIPGGRIRLKLSHVNLDCHEEDTGYTPLIIAVLNGKSSKQVNTLKLQSYQKLPAYAVCCSSSNSVDPDQTAPIGAV